MNTPKIISRIPTKEWYDNFDKIKWDDEEPDENDVEPETENEHILA